jgi:hypothetical protein
MSPPSRDTEDEAVVVVFAAESALPQPAQADTASTTVTIRDAERLSITIQTPRAAQKFRAATPTAGLPSAAVA